MALKDIVRSGDIILTCPRNTIGNLIAKFTFGQVNHAAIVYDQERLFETDADLYKAGFAPLDKYSNRSMFIVRPKYIESSIQDMQRLCKKYDGKPYSYFDIVTNAMFFFLARQIRHKAVAFFGRRDFMVCSELVARILYEATGNKLWKDFEGMTPEDIRDIALENPKEHEITEIIAK